LIGLIEAQRIHDPQMLTEKAKAWGVRSLSWFNTMGDSGLLVTGSFCLMFFVDVCLDMNG